MSSTPDRYDPSRDPTRMSNQPALRTSRGAIWLIVGGLLAAIAIAELAFLVTGPAAVVAIVGIVLEAALYLGMVIVTLTVRVPTRRLGLLAIGMIIIAVVAVGSLWLIASSVTLG
jgi:hypothetical protein